MQNGQFLGNLGYYHYIIQTAKLQLIMLFRLLVVSFHCVCRLHSASHPLNSLDLGSPEKKLVHMVCACAI